MKREIFAALAIFVVVGMSQSVQAGLLTPVTVENLDAGAFARFVDGKEQAIKPADGRDSAGLPQWIVWTDKTASGHSGLAIGASKTPGPRHVRVGFKNELPVGAVLVRGGARVSVLKAGAAYPGDMGDESQWISAQRIRAGQVSADEGAKENYVLWTLPRAVGTRALRFSHEAQVTDKDYAGWIGGAYVLADRAANLAPQAIAVASASQNNAKKLNNEHLDPVWEQWSNMAKDGGQRPAAVSDQSPEWVMLVWPAEVKLRGLGAVFAGFGEAEAQAYAGPADVHPREAPESAWKGIKSFSGLKNRYPVALPVDWLDFGQEVTTRALRLKIVKPAREGGHPHTNGHTKEGKRVWLGELVALTSLGDAEFKTAILPSAASGENPPIPVKFSIPEAGWVTLVIEDSGGKRVRNLVADTYFEKGENVAWWDGSDDLARDPSAASHGLYYIPTQFVQPGEYRVRGLWRKQVNLTYEFGVYAAGKTPWETADKTGGWLSNHTPPSAVLFVPDAPDGENRKPAVLIGSYVSEGTAGLAWVDLDGVKFKGQGWVGGTWTGAPHLARDAGKNAVAGTYAYAAAAWDAATDKKERKKQGEIRITALTAGADKPIGKFPFTPVANEEGNVWWESQIGGLAVHDGVIVVSMPSHDKLMFVKAETGRLIGESPLEKPHGLAFDAAGKLYAASGKRVVCFASVADPTKLAAPAVVVGELEDPHGIALDGKGNLYVADRGKSHQVKAFSVEGKAGPVIGRAGEPRAGLYDSLHMNNPRGVTIDPQGRLWVAEEDSQPKRISIWNPDGTLVRAFYGPMEYGGGGSIDPLDKTRFYYGGIEFKLDWEKGVDQVHSIFYRRKKGDLKLPLRSGVPETAIYVEGRRYWTNCFTSNPTSGHGTAFIFADRDGIAVPCAAAGRANEWETLKTDAMKSVWPEGTDPKANQHTSKAAFFIWSDLNADGQVQADEVKLQRGVNGGVTVMRDLSFAIARLDGKATRLGVKSYTAQGVPQYAIGEAKALAADCQPSSSSGGDQVLADVDGWVVHTTAPKPSKPSALGGTRNGAPLWTYPSLWPGLHASHEAPVPDRAGMLIGTTRLLGDFVTPSGGEPLWMVNGNHGPVYVFTADGLFVAQLMQDMRVGRPWHMPVAQRGMRVNELTPSDENFWPNVTRTSDGKVYLTAGRPGSIVRVDGLETVRRIAASPLNVSTEDLNKAREYYVRAEAARQAAQGRGVMTVAIRKKAPAVDGKLDDWSMAQWVDIDKRGTAAYFNSSSKPYNVTGAVAVTGERLYAAWRTGDKSLLKNAGDVPHALFKTGGALDLMIGADAAANPKRTAPVEGDLRLLVTQVGGKTRALLYRAVAKEKQPVPFSSPWRTITLDRVDDVSEQVKLAAGADGDYEISVPLSVLGLSPSPSKPIRGDIGILRGTGTVTTQRVYWSNKATAIVADVPSEAELRPGLWGGWEFGEGGK